jgi:pilus assembly protein Flp/PilA
MVRGFILHPLLFSGGIIMLFRPREEGQGLLEYALIIMLVALVVIILVTVLGPTVGNMYSNVMSVI